MNNPKQSKLWLGFTMGTFVLMVFSHTLLGVVISMLFRDGRIPHTGPSRLIPFIGFFFASVIIAAFITSFIIIKILKPVSQLSKATKEVAKGNFLVRMPEKQQGAEMQEMAHSFNLMVQELGGIETLRSDFIANVSHEFKTPLAGIEGYATLLQDPNLSQAERDEYTKIIINSTKQLTDLSSNILKLSKLENQEILTDQTTYRLDEQLRQALLLLENKWSAKNISLDLAIEDVAYYGNQSLMMQVWLNLLGNAIKFTPPNGDINVSLKQNLEQIIIQIADSGIGMTAEMQKHIFEKFYQGDEARNSQGNGLGLPLVKRILELTQGEITVQSQVGFGSTFTVNLKQIKKHI